MGDTQINRVAEARNLWVATVRPDGRPHLTPVWAVVHEEAVYLCIQSKSVKAGNLSLNDRIACALEDGTSPVIFEGRAEALPQPWPVRVKALFLEKYSWDLDADPDYDLLLAIRPRKWLAWN